MINHTTAKFLAGRAILFLGKRYASSDVRVRFAPSPTGQLHLGGLRTALVNYLFAKSHGGTFILRIENTDQSRVVPGAVEKMVSALEWAGIEIDEGPNFGGEFGPYVQSERLPLYQEAAETLLQSGAAYKCFCSSRRLDIMRREAAKRGEVQKYDNRCRQLTQEEVNEKITENIPHVVRFKLELLEEPWQDLVYGPILCDVAEREGDPIIMKSDGFPTYHLANVVDDHHMKISHVLRGVEWQVSTDKHILLYKAFGWQPPQFVHLPLLLNKDGKKFSKRQNDVHVEYYKDQGYSSEAVLSLLTSTGAGFNVRDPTHLSLQQLIKHFDLSKLRTQSSKIDFDKLPEFNQYHLRQKFRDPEQKDAFIKEIRQMLSQPSSRYLSISNVSDDYLEKVLEWALERIKMLPDLKKPIFDFLWCAPSFEHLKPLSLNVSETELQLSKTIDILNGLPEEKDESLIQSMLRSCSSDSEWKFSQYMKTLRTAISGLKEGPSVAEMVTVIGKKEAVSRLQRALVHLKT